jgi:hypothetical protein
MIGKAGSASRRQRPVPVNTIAALDTPMANSSSPDPGQTRRHIAAITEQLQTLRAQHSDRRPVVTLLRGVRSGARAADR